MIDMINIVLSGGSGTRLWPLSRTKLPKQFVKLLDQQSLFQKTLLRNEKLCDSLFVVTNSEQYFLAMEQLEHSGANTFTKSQKFLLEPIGRNTAPAIALACMVLDPEDIVLVTPSDHIVEDEVAYKNAIEKAKMLAAENHLVTFGIQPSFPETGFGYIEAEGHDVVAFKEKPKRTVAENYIAKGNYYWNSGMFCFKAGAFLAELKKYRSDIFTACELAIYSTQETVKESDNAIAPVIRIAHELMETIPAESIDYAVMELSKNVKVVPCSMGWSDVGSFDALYTYLKNGNTTPENASLLCESSSQAPLALNSYNNLVISSDRQIALIDIDDLLVVDTSDALLISKKSSSQKVKQVVETLKKSRPELTDIHRLAHRPWGTYEVLIDSEGYKVKRIVVRPGGRLSLQKHFHRNEHWIIVSGSATVTVDGITRLLRPNESTYIKMGQTHRLENDGKIDLVMIEVQVGEYTGEDDIVRIEDIYARNE